MRWILFLPAAFFFLLPVLNAIVQSRKQRTMERQQQISDCLEQCTNLYLRGAETPSLSVCRNCIDELKTAQAELHALAPNVDDKCEKEDMAELREHLHELEEADWCKKSGKHLQAFSDYYSLIMSDTFHTFSDVKKLFWAKKKCLDEWHKYFAVDLEDYETTIYPKRYLREFMDEDYDPCMESSADLDKKLSDRIQTMRPEYKRKIRLYDLIVDYVAKHPDVARSKLIKVSFDGFTQQEVASCYRGLIDKRRLIEIKIGSRYFVSLTDKELNRQIGIEKKDTSKTKNRITQECAKAKDDSMIDTKPKVLYSALIQHLSDMGVEYIDKTSQGGGLYFFDKSIANELKAKGFELHFTENETKGTGRPREPVYSVH